MNKVNVITYRQNWGSRKERECDFAKSWTHSVSEGFYVTLALIFDTGKRDRQEFRITEKTQFNLKRRLSTQTSGKKEKGDENETHAGAVASRP